jgi:hypothetical protein
MSEQPASVTPPPTASATTPQPPPYAVPTTDPASGAAPSTGLYRITLTKVTSFLIMTNQRRVVVTGTIEQLEQATRSAMIHNLVCGWWGFPFGIVWTPLALIRNSKNLRAAKALATNGSFAR